MPDVLHRRIEEIAQRPIDGKVKIAIRGHEPGLFDSQATKNPPSEWDGGFFWLRGQATTDADTR